jgi:hypothetical protein
MGGGAQKYHGALTTCLLSMRMYVNFIGCVLFFFHSTITVCTLDFQDLGFLKNVSAWAALRCVLELIDSVCMYRIWARTLVYFFKKFVVDLLF